MVGELDFPSSEIFYYQEQQFDFAIDTSMNVEIITNKAALHTVRNKKKELKDLDNHAWENNSETTNQVAEALESVDELETVLDQSKESMYKLSYVVRVTAPDVEELKRRCNQVRDFYDDASIKLVRPIGDMMGLHNEFIPSSKRYMNDYVQYVTSDFLAGLGFGATQMLGERDGIYLGYNVDTDQNVYVQPAKAAQGVKGSVTNALSGAFLGSLGGGKSLSFNLLTYYAVLNGAQALILDPKSERGLWKEKLPEIADEINIVNLTSDEENKGMLDPYIIMRKTKDAESLALDVLTFLTGISSRDGKLFPVLRRAVRAVTNSETRGLLRVIDALRDDGSETALAVEITLNRSRTMTLLTCCSPTVKSSRLSALKSSLTLSKLLIWFCRTRTPRLRTIRPSKCCRSPCLLSFPPLRWTSSIQTAVSSRWLDLMKHGRSSMWHRAKRWQTSWFVPVVR